MSRTRKFTLVEWWVRDDFACIIRPYKPEDQEHDGTNWVTGHLQDGCNFVVCESLDEAINKSTFKIGYITFEDLTKEENLHVEYLKEAGIPLIY